MKERVLFSCVGNTDPMNEKNLHDGPILHIIRNYKPNYVYLYLSCDMIKHHKEENRYEPYFDKMKDFLGIDFEVVYIEKPDLVQPQLFDSFFQDMRDELNKIKKKHPNSEILGNVSSGTPAMKSAIQVLSAFLNFEMTTIQVDTPEKGTHHTSDKILIDYWEINEDNEKNVNRCHESSVTNLNKEIKSNLINQFIDIYDYNAAYKTAISISELLDSKVTEYLYFQKCREELRIKDGRKNLKTLSRKDLFDRGDSFKSNIYEYFLRWNAQGENKEFLSFILGLSPLLANLQKLALNKYSLGKVFLHDDGILAKCKFDEESKSILSNNGLLLSGNSRYRSYDINCLIQKLNYIPEEAKELFSDLRNVEEKIRNDAAHQIVSISNKTIREKTGFDVNQIRNKTWKLICLLDSELGSNPDIYKRAYDIINEKIKTILNEG